MKWNAEINIKRFDLTQTGTEIEVPADSRELTPDDRGTDTVFLPKKGGNEANTSVETENPGSVDI